MIFTDRNIDFNHQEDLLLFNSRVFAYANAYLRENIPFLTKFLPGCHFHFVRLYGGIYEQKCISTCNVLAKYLDSLRNFMTKYIPLRYIELFLQWIPSG